MPKKVKHKRIWKDKGGRWRQPGGKFASKLAVKRSKAARKGWRKRKARRRVVERPWTPFKREGRAYVGPPLPNIPELFEAFVREDIEIFPAPDSRKHIDSLIDKLAARKRGTVDGIAIIAVDKPRRRQVYVYYVRIVDKITKQWKEPIRQGRSDEGRYFGVFELDVYDYVWLEGPWPLDRALKALAKARRAKWARVSMVVRKAKKRKKRAKKTRK